MNDDELLQLIKNEFYSIKPKGCWDFFRQRDKRIPCLPVLKKKFNMTYNQILIRAGVIEKELSFVRGDIEETLKALKKLTLELGHTPSVSEFREKGYSIGVINRYFGSYNKSLEMLDLRTNKSPEVVCETKEELLQMYIDFSNRIGKPASINDLDISKDVYSASVFYKRFGGMMNLKKEAGFEPLIRGKAKYTKTEVNRRLKDLYLERKGKLKTREIDRISGLPSRSTILKLYKTTKMETVWNEIEKEIKCDKAS